MSTTLTVVAVRLAQGAAPQAIAVWVGDSGVWRLRRGGWQSMTPLKGAGDEVSSSMTDALPWLHGGEPQVIEFPVDPGDVVVVATDGVGDLLGTGHTPQAAFLAERWSEPPSTPQYIAEVDLHVQSFDDDRTAVAIWVDGTPDHTFPPGIHRHEEVPPPAAPAVEKGCASGGTDGWGY